MALNYSEPHKQSFKPVDKQFLVKINQSVIVRSNSDNYLGVIVELSLSKYLEEIALKLSRCSSLLYYLRKFVTKETLDKIYKVGQKKLHP